MILDCDITLTRSNCSGFIIAKEEVINRHSNAMFRKLKHKLSENAQILIEGFPLFLDGIRPKFDKGVVRYNLNIDHITSRTWHGVFERNREMWATNTEIEQRITNFATNARQNLRNARASLSNKLFSVSQLYEGESPIAIENEQLSRVLEEFNENIMLGSRIGSLHNDKVLQLDSQSITSTAPDGSITRYQINEYKGVGYASSFFPDLVTIRKVGPFYFTRCERSQRFGKDGRQSDVYAKLPRAERVLYSRQRGEMR